MKKRVVISIIVLFVGVAVAPSINAGITVKKDIQETIVTSDSEDDCNCNDEFDDNDKFERPICGFLQLLIAYYLKFSDIFDELAWNDRPYPRPLQNIWLRLSEIMDARASEIIEFGVSIDCWDYPYP